MKVGMHKLLGVGGSDNGAAAAPCKWACVSVWDQTLTPRKRPCFPYLTTTEHVSPWPQAVLFMGFACVCFCVHVCAMFIVCPCSLFAWGAVQHYIFYCSLSSPSFFFLSSCHRTTTRSNFLSIHLLFLSCFSSTSSITSFFLFRPVFPSLALNPQRTIMWHIVSGWSLLGLPHILIELRAGKEDCDVNGKIKRRGGRWGRRVLKQAYILHEHPPPHPSLHRMAVYCSGAY